MIPSHRLCVAPTMDWSCLHKYQRLMAVWHAIGTANCQSASSLGEQLGSSAEFARFGAPRVNVQEAVNLIL